MRIPQSSLLAIVSTAANLPTSPRDGQRAFIVSTKLEAIAYQSFWYATGTAVAPLPVITSLSVSSGTVTDTVVITGTGFLGITSVTFFSSVSAVYVVNSPTQITATVPAGFATGVITVTNPVGSGASGTFTRLTYDQVILADSPAVYWKLDDASSPAVDSSGHGRNGTAGGSIVFHDSSIVTDGTFSMSANNTNASVTIAAGLGIGPNTSFSLETWMTVSSLAALCNVMFALPAVPPIGLFGMDVATSGAIQWGVLSENVTAGSVITVGPIFHIVLTFNGSTHQEILYVNGVQMGIRTPAGAAVATMASIGIGGNAGFGFKWAGKYQDFAAYISTLTPALVARHYAAGM